MVLESVCIGVIKNLRDFMVQCFCFFFFVKETLCQIPIDDRVINTELPSLRRGLDDFSQMSWSPFIPQIFIGHQAYGRPCAQLQIQLWTKQFLPLGLAGSQSVLPVL